VRVPDGTRVGLCAHVPSHPATGAGAAAPATVAGMVLEVATDEGEMVVLVCTGCWLRYAADGDLAPIVARQLVVGQAGWDVEFDLEVPS
jgi:hypothetical protein